MHNFFYNFYYDIVIWLINVLGNDKIDTFLCFNFKNNNNNNKEI